MRALIAYASAHGSTRDIAERIGKVLSVRGVHVDVRSADQVGRIERYDLLVIGSAVHDQQWLAQAADLVRRCAASLAGRPVWLFSVGMPGALRWPLKRWAYAEEPKLRAQFEGEIEPIAHCLFSGVIAPEHLPLTGRLVFRAIGGRYGDYRDWREIEAWASAIAESSSASV